MCLEAEHSRMRLEAKLGISYFTIVLDAICHVALWRNGSASDSRSEGWVFESLTGQHFILENVAFYKISTFSCIHIL